MLTLRPFRALAALPLFSIALAAQGTTTRAPSSVAPAPAGARRDTTPHDGARPASVVPMPASARRAGAGSSDDNQILAFVATLGAMAIGGTAGALYDDACFGDGEKMAGRALLSGLAISIPGSIIADVVHRPDTMPATRPARRAPAVHVPEAVAIPLAGAAVGAVLGAPIGAVQGARHPERCGGSMARGLGRGTGQMAVGGAVVGAGLAALVGASALVERLGEPEAQARVDSLARAAGIRPDTIRGRQEPSRNALLSFVLPGAGHVRAGEVRRGAQLAALTFGVASLSMYGVPDRCIDREAAGPPCSGADRKRATIGLGATALVWGFAVADGYGAAERHNRRLVERAVARAGVR